MKRSRVSSVSDGASDIEIIDKECDYDFLTEATRYPVSNPSVPPIPAERKVVKRKARALGEGTAAGSGGAGGAASGVATLSLTAGGGGSGGGGSSSSGGAASAAAPSLPLKLDLSEDILTAVMTTGAPSGMHAFAATNWEALRQTGIVRVGVPCVAVRALETEGKGGIVSMLERVLGKVYKMNNYVCEYFMGKCDIMGGRGPLLVCVPSLLLFFPFPPSLPSTIRFI
jgi:hypothetical protein